MSEYRVMLEGGQVLVVTLEIEDAAEAAAPDPASFGAALLNALGLGEGGKRTAAPQKRPKRPAPPPEPSAEEWLEQSSRDALRRMQ